MHLTLYAVSAGTVYALKSHYHSATSTGLEWILAPTAWGVQVLTGVAFSPDSILGYVSNDGTVVIAPSCAGVNFLIICFCMLVFTQLRRAQHPAEGVLLWLALGISAYAATLIVNTVRIAVSMASLQAHQLDGLLGFDDRHRIEGIAIYFLALSLVYGIAQAVPGHCAPRRNTSVISAAPLFWYLAIALGIPLLRGAYRHDTSAFIEHGFYVVLIPALILLSIFITKQFIARTSANAP